MNIPCAQKSNFCPCTDNPLANLSSEEPDRELFINIKYNNLLDGAPIVICEEGSLEDLANCHNVCNPDLETCPCDPILDNCPCPECPSCQNPPCHSCTPPPPCNPIIITTYYSAQSTCMQCGVSYTLPAGAVISQVSQIDANERAQSICQSRVNELAARSGACQVNTTCSPSPVISGYGQSSPVTAGVGENLTLNVFYFYLGSRTLTFLWYKDGIPFEPGIVVGNTASLVITNLTLGDAGTYILGIKPQGCSEIFSNPIEVQMVGCNCGFVGQVPLDFLEADGSIVVDFTGSVSGGVPNNTTNFSTVPGRFALKYIGGYSLECEHNGHNVGDCASSANRSIAAIDADVWADHDNNGTFETNVAFVLFGSDVTEVGNVPANTCQHGHALGVTQSALFFGNYPDGIVAGISDLLPVVGLPTFNGFIRCAPNPFFLWPLGAICGGQYPTDVGDCTDGIPICPGTNNTRFQLIRTHKFADRVWPVTIKDFALVAPMIVPSDSIGPDLTDQWSGQFAEEPSQTLTVEVYTILSTVWGIGNVTVNQSEIRAFLGPTGFWRLRIFGSWTDSFSVPHIKELLWEGKKYKGSNALGSYCYVASLNPSISVPNCIILI